MLQPSEKYQARSIEAIAIKKEQHRMRRHQHLFRAATTLTVLGVAVGAYAGNVRVNQEIEQSSHIRLNVISEALDPLNNSNALVYIGGFRDNNADELAEYKGQAIQPVVDGQEWSIDYNNSGLADVAIARRIIAEAEESGVTSLSLIGYSAGGPVTMQVLEILYKESSLDIKTIFLISAPDGVETLRPSQQHNLELIEKIKGIPGIAYSTPAQIIGEMAMRADNYTSSDSSIENVEAFLENLDEVQESLKNNTVPGTWLMFKQLLAIEQANIKDRIEHIGELPNTTMRPTIVYLGTAKPGYDYMVDSKAASGAIGGYAEAANIPYFVFNVPGAVHSKHELAVDAYIQTVAEHKDDIINSVAKQESIAYGNLLLQRYNPNGPPTTEELNTELDHSEPHSTYTPSPSATESLQ